MNQGLETGVAEKPDLLADFDSVQQSLLAATPTLDLGEQLSLEECAGRVLLDDVIAAHDMPHADNSAMDGYAIRYADYADGATFPVQDCHYAGDMPPPLQPGKATRLFTGSLLPEGADTVVMQEHVSSDGECIRINKPIRAGQHVRRRGEFARHGDTLIARSTLLNAAHTGLLAMQGIGWVRVQRKLRVGILTTGDELVRVGEPLRAEQSYDSNGPMLSALVRGMGASVTARLHAKDDFTQTRAAIAHLLAHSDLVISAGGISTGEKDLLHSVLDSLGGELEVCKVRMKPGKPFSVGTVAGKKLVCLPGNPGAAYVVFALMVSPMLRQLQGRSAVLPRTPRLPLVGRTRVAGHRDEFIRVELRVASDGTQQLHPFDQQSPGSLNTLAAATGLARIRAGGSANEGERVEYYDFDTWLA
ncbi:gephyrin-like molybdotransferase Glp [Burkholderia sp. Ac-20365]|uniref:molybdopterin molybdotransferase MoeA n=1 Tax=Burkholderia sp. Ac-20365 TaxID=2703897 RepID=UPI00197C7C02|nr:gephyrin-like molybdotransferase Glp [Burkholderia sp. Ac-20365]MBN3759354.1 molybdopterin molybdotransferase MoeA [Burkholderia sp. Ac-20365]